MIEDCSCGHGHGGDVTKPCLQPGCGCQVYRARSQQAPTVGREVVVQAISFNEHGLTLDWMVLPDDVRSQSHVVTSRQTSVSFQTPAGLGAAATDLRTSVDALGRQLLQALEAEDVLPVYEPPATEALGYTAPRVDDDDDDDVGMGEGR